MKKSLLLVLAIGCVNIVTAQNVNIPKVHPSMDKTILRSKDDVISGHENKINATQKSFLKKPKPYSVGSFKKNPTETLIGQTTYDLQTNASVQNRIINHGNGTISVVWTYSNDFGTTWTDRGSGYNYFDGSIWGSLPTSRIESERIGWPNIATTTSGAEVIIAHSTASNVLIMDKRNTIGTGAWNAIQPITTSDQVWNRMTIGGANGQTIHQISLRTPTSLGGIEHIGVDGHILYFRSLDGGTTWDIQDAVIPGLDSSNFVFMSGDSYHIAEAKGDTLALAYFGGLNDVIFAKSTDNGDNWTLTKIVDVFPGNVKFDPASNATTGNVIGISDIDGDQIADTVSSSDGAGWVLLDDNGMAHVFYGNMRYLDDTPGDDSWSYFPGTNGLMYWNESFGSNPPVAIAGALDLDGDGTLNGIIDIALYFVSLSGIPSAGIDANGCIYVSYSAIMETLDQGSQNYRHVYIVKSCDGGCTWTYPIDVTPTGDFVECVFASMARDVDSSVHIVYQSDFEPGIAVRGDLDPVDLNDIIYLKVPVTDLDTTIGACVTMINGITEFCPGDSVLLTSPCGDAFLWSTGDTTQSIYATSYGTITVNTTTACGVIQDSIVLDSITIGNPPSFTISSTTTVMCNGDSAWITASSVSSGSYLWSTGATTQTIGVDSVGTYIITVTNCGGSSVDSITISLPANLPVASISGNMLFCLGDSILLTAGTEPSATYLWSTGETTQSIYVDTSKTYTLYVTNCSGIDSTDLTTNFEPLVPATITPSNDTTVCGSIILNASTGDSYLWSTGDTTLQIVVTASGSISVTVFNVCGVGTTSATTVVTIEALPPAPTITVNGDTLTSSATTGNQWYINGNVMSTAIYQNLVPTQSGTYTVTVTDPITDCESLPSIGEVIVITGINEINSGIMFNIYPNPNNGQFIIELNNVRKEDQLIEVRNIIGQLIYTEEVDKISGELLKIDLSEHNRGVYFLSISSSSGTRTEKLIVY